MTSLRSELKQIRGFESPEQEAFLNLQRTTSVLSGSFIKTLKDSGLSMPLYNILRILRGQRDGGLSCTHIGDRMVTRDPDVTRLIDRLQRSELVQRHRSTTDRRVVVIAITEKGRELLTRLDDPMLDLHKKSLGHLTRTELKELNRLLVKARGQ